MKIGIIGSGNMGSAFARRLAASRHGVVLTSRNLDDAKKLASNVGGRAVEQNQIAAHAAMIIAAVPFQEEMNALRAAGDLSGKIVIEIANPIEPAKRALPGADGNAEHLLGIRRGDGHCDRAGVDAARVR